MVAHSAQRTFQMLRRCWLRVWRCVALRCTSQVFASVRDTDLSVCVWVGLCLIRTTPPSTVNLFLLRWNWMGNYFEKFVDGSEHKNPQPTPGTEMLKCSLKRKFKQYFSTLYAYNKYSSVHFVCLACSQSLRQFSQFSLITLKHRTCYNPGLIVRARLSASVRESDRQKRARDRKRAKWEAKRVQLSRSSRFWIFTSFVFDGSILTLVSYWKLEAVCEIFK